MGDTPAVLDAAALAARRGWVDEQEAREVLGAGPISLETLVEHGFLSAQQARDLVPPEALAAARDPGNVYGRYIRYRELGRGGFGTVWLAWDVDLGRRVALKLLHEHEPSELARFRREAQAVAQLSHPHIVAVYDVGEANGEPYIAMQYVDGEPVGTRAFPPGTALRIASQAADALAYAHSRGVIHRDIKPGNILLDDEGKAYLMDFGLAKNLQVDATLSATGEVFGTPGFMPPEQATGEVLKMGPHTDVWGLGATLYALLAGRPPFEGQNPYEIVRKVLEDPPAPPTKVVPRLSRDVEAVVLKCLEKPPERRYRTAVELADDLRRCLDGETPQAALTGALVSRKIRAARQSIVRRRVPLLVASTVAALALAGLAIVLLQPDPMKEADRHYRGARAEYNRGRFDLCEQHLHRALAAVRDHPPALFLFGLVRARQYQATRELPPAYIVGGYLTFESQTVGPGTGLEEAARLFVDADAARARHPEIALPAGFPELVAGLRAFADGNPKEAIPSLQAAALSMGAQELWVGWLAAETCYYAQDFSRGKEYVVNTLSRGEAAQMITPDWGLIEARMSHALGLQRTLAGEDPTEEFENALTTCTYWLNKQLAPAQEARFRLLKVQVLLSLGEFEESRGTDPQRRYEAAATECDDLLRESREDPLALHARGDQALADAENRRARGLVTPDDAMPYPEAVRFHREGIEKNGRWAQGWTKKATALEALARYWLSVGRLDEAEDACREAINAFAAADRIQGGREVFVRMGLARVQGLVERRWPETSPDLDHLEEYNECMEGSFTRETTALREACALAHGYGPALLELGRAHVEWADFRERQGIDAAEQYEGAFGAYDLAPPSAFAFLSRGRAYLQRGANRADRSEDPAGDYQRAIDDFGRAINTKRDLVDAYVARAAAYERLAAYEQDHGGSPTDSYEQAMADLVFARGINEHHPRVYAQLGYLKGVVAFYEFGRDRQDPAAKFESAVEDHDRASTETKGQWGEAFLGRGRTRLLWARAAWTLGDRILARDLWRLALEDMTTAVDLNPIDPEALSSRGTAHNNLATYQDLETELSAAIEDFLQVLRLNPTWSATLLRLAPAEDRLARFQLERDRDPGDLLDKAHGHMQRALAMNPQPRNRIQLLQLLCLNRAQAGDLDAAQAVFQEIVAEAPGQAASVAAHLGYGLGLHARALKSRGQPDDALRFFDEALRWLDLSIERGGEEEADYVRRYLLRGETRYQAGRYTEAVDDAEEAKTRDPSLAPEADDIIERARHALGPEY